eukprot:scaffold5475_cov127-Isochrysis_galbana.AAC.14
MAELNFSALGKGLSLSDFSRAKLRLSTTTTTPHGVIQFSAEFSTHSLNSKGLLRPQTNLTPTALTTLPAFESQMVTW